MSAPSEVLLTSESSGQLWNIGAWDPSSGTQLSSLKGGSSAASTLCMLQQQYVLSAVCNKPLIHVWALQRKDQNQQRMVCPGLVSALATSPDGLYCVAGIAEKIHIWQVATGHLLAVLSRHYQTITCVQFTDDGSHFVTGGEDNLVLVWSLARVLSDKTSRGLEPEYTWSQHSLPVTAVYIGPGGLYSRVATASLDHTVKLWDLCSGELLCSFIFDDPVTMVTMDAAEMRLFAGTSAGNVCQVNLFEKPVRVERHITEDTDSHCIFEGHSKQISAMAVSLDGLLLVTGSHDMTVKLWDVPSRQCIRTLQHKGAITNVMLVRTPRGLLSQENQSNPPMLPLTTFQRHLHGTQAPEQSDTVTRETVTVVIPQRMHENGCIKAEDELLQRSYKELGNQEPDPEDLERELRGEIEKLKRVNKDIYDFTLDKVLHHR